MLAGFDVFEEVFDGVVEGLLGVGKAVESVGEIIFKKNNKLYKRYFIVILVEKLIILGRTNWDDGFYIKFEASEKSMKTIKNIVESFGSEYFLDNQVIPKTFSNYAKWKDQWIPVTNQINKLKIDIICGDRIIHFITHNCKKFELVNNIIDQYCDWKRPE